MSKEATTTISELDALPRAAAERLLMSCCGACRWVERMVAARPFGERDTLLRLGEEIWWSLEPADWREAFAHHPRIGERDAAVAPESRALAWSAAEQRGVADATAAVRAALAEENREYERRFGHIYLVAAAGKTASELLALLRARLSNDPATELRVAAGEQAKITRLRLLKLLELTEAETAAGGPAALRRPPSART
jgi:2-oxo-4-hydroxy-4-carboxy-5-ureidoimidazoline decarboxylase